MSTDLRIRGDYMYSHIITTVSCPKCKAPLGERCRLKGWDNKKALRPHNVRMEQYNKAVKIRSKLKKV